MKENLKFIPYSNGFYKIKHIKVIKPGLIIKRIILVLISIIFIGFGYQYLSDKIELKDLTTKNKYVKIDNKKYYFNAVGDEKPTIILESDIGFGLSEWQRVQDIVKEKYSLRTFAYDRVGYGFSDYSKRRTPEEQAKLLRMILKKVSLTGPFILAGEGYGALAICNFAKLYPDLVKGVILINPINEAYLNDKEYINEFSKNEFKSNIQRVGSYIGLNEVLDNMGVLKGYESLDDYMKEEDVNNYNILRTKKNFTAAYNDELKNITEMKSNAQTQGMFNNVPLVIVVNNNKNKEQQESLNILGSPQLTKIINVESDTGIVPLENPEVMLESVKYILDNSEK